MAILTREKILNAVDIHFEIVPVPEWGGEVWVRSLSGSERDAFEASIVEFKGKKTAVKIQNIRAKLAALTMVDSDGPKAKRLFSDADVLILGKKSASALDRVYTVAQRLSGISDEDIEELEKNSGPTPDDDSTLT